MMLNYIEIIDVNKLIALTGANFRCVDVGINNIDNYWLNG